MRKQDFIRVAQRWGLSILLASMPICAEPPKAVSAAGASLGGSAGVHAWAHDIAHRVYPEVSARGGATFVPGQGFTESEGYAYSPYPERETVVQDLTEKKLEDFIEHNAGLLRGHPGNALGVWTDQASHMTYLDVSVVDQDRDHAIAEAGMAHQLAIYDFRNHREIRIDTITCEVGLKLLTYH